MAKDIALYLLGFKGFYVLQEIIKTNLSDKIAFVVSMYDNTQEDYCDNIKELCQKCGIAFYLYGYSPEIPHYVFAISWRRLIHTENKVIVLHDSILPKYRGFNPLVSALINGDKKIGVSALFGENAYDSGDILAQKSIDISYPLTIFEAINKVSVLYAEIVIELLNKVLNKKDLIGIPQNTSLVSYSLWRDEFDYFIPWEFSARKIERFIDAVGYPYAGARAFCGDVLVKVLKARALDDVKIINRDIGKIIFKEQGCPVIVCKKGLLKIIKMQTLEGQPFVCEKFRTRFSSKGG